MTDNPSQYSEIIPPELSESSLISYITLSTGLKVDFSLYIKYIETSKITKIEGAT